MPSVGGQAPPNRGLVDSSDPAAEGYTPPGQPPQPAPQPEKDKWRIDIPSVVGTFLLSVAGWALIRVFDGTDAEVKAVETRAKEGRAELQADLEKDLGQLRDDLKSLSDKIDALAIQCAKNEVRSQVNGQKPQQSPPPP